MFFTAFTFNGSEPDGRALQAKKSSRNLPPLFGFTLGFVSSASDALHCTLVVATAYGVAAGTYAYVFDSPIYYKSESYTYTWTVEYGW